MRIARPLSAAVAAALLLSLVGCSGGASGERAGTGAGSAADGEAYPVTLKNTFGTTEITKKPVRVATVAWSNGEVPLALGVVPVGMAKATWGDDDGDGVLPWVEDRLRQLKAKTPVLFDETDGIDFEAVADTRPDVILAAYSGLKKDEYATLSKIAPVVSYPELAWGTSLNEMIRLDSAGMGMKAEGERLVSKLDGEIADTAAAHPDLKGKRAMFGYFDTNDLSKVGFYTTHDTRPAFFERLGMTAPKVVSDASAKTDEFYTTVSAERVDAFQDVDVIVTYGDAKLLQRLQQDPLLSKIPAIRKGAVALLPDSTPLAASANPTPLSIGWGLGEYVDLLSAAAGRAG